MLVGAVGTPASCFGFSVLRRLPVIFLLVVAVVATSVLCCPWLCAVRGSS